MSISTVARLKSRMGIPASVTAEDAELGVLLEQVEAACESSLNRKLAQAIHTQVLDGSGTQWLWLTHAPVTVVGCYAATTLDSAVVTVPAADAAHLVAGMPAYGTGIPAGATVASTSGTSVTLSAVATATSSAAWCVFGIEVREDQTGMAAGGLAEGYLGTASILAPGADYAPRLDDPLGDGRRSASGLVERLNVFWPRMRSRQPAGVTAGNLAASSLAAGYYGPPSGRGCVKVTYCGGFATIPAEIELAVLEAAALARTAAKEGRLLSGESWQGYSYSTSPLAANAAWLGYFGGPGGKTLARHRRIVI